MYRAPSVDDDDSFDDLYDVDSFDVDSSSERTGDAGREGELGEGGDRGGRGGGQRKHRVSRFSCPRLLRRYIKLVMLGRLTVLGRTMVISISISFALLVAAFSFAFRTLNRHDLCNLPCQCDYTTSKALYLTWCEQFSGMCRPLAYNKTLVDAAVKGLTGCKAEWNILAQNNTSPFYNSLGSKALYNATFGKLCRESLWRGEDDAATGRYTDRNVQVVVAIDVFVLNFLLVFFCQVLFNAAFMTLDQMKKSVQRLTALVTASDSLRVSGAGGVFVRPSFVRKQLGHFMDLDCPENVDAFSKMRYYVVQL